MRTGVLKSKGKLKDNFLWIASYSVCFCIAALLVFGYFIYYRKSMVWDVDGLYQHYNAFVYLGTWCRELIRNVIFEHQFVIPMWEWGLGLGSDVMTTLSYYTFGDPFALISVVTPVKYAEWSYALSIILRFYMAGFAFCLYSQKMNCEKWSIVCAAILYAFCAFSIFCGVRHPYFVNPMIYFPLILLGCEKVFARETPVVLILSVFITVFSNFYFFYKTAIFTVIYVLLRLITNDENRKIKIILQKTIQIGICAITGVLLACVLFFPDVMAFLGNSRVTDTYEVPLLYSLGEYEKFVGTFIGGSWATNYAIVGLAPIAYLATGVSFIQRKKENRWALLFIVIQLIFMLFPVFGHILNGFGYVSNRWVFVWAFTISFLFAKKLPELLSLSTKEKGYLSIGYGVYALACIFSEKSRTEDVLIGIIFLFISLAFVWCAPYIKDFKFKKIVINSYKIKQLIVMVFVFIFVHQISYQRYSHLEENYLDEFENMTTVNRTLFKEHTSVLNLIEGDDFYRVENVVPGNTQKNYAISNGQSTSMAYWSLINPNVTEFIELNSLNDRQTYCNRGFQSRSMILPLINAKYYIANDSTNKDAMVPYDFHLIGKTTTKENSYYLYETENSLPFGYTYDKYLSKSEYEALSIAERQQVTLQAAVVDTDNISSLKKVDAEYSDVKINYEIKPDENIIIEENSFIVKENNSTLSLVFEAPENSELYLSFSGLSLEEKNSYSFKDESFWDGLTRYEEVKIKESLKYWQPKTESTIYVKCDDAAVSVKHYNNDSRYSTGREDYLINLGYSEKTRVKAVVKFERAGIYKFEELSLISQPVDNIELYVSELSQDYLTNVKMSTNKITGDISLDESKLLCLSLPYTDGWKCYVDGEEVETIKTNIMLTGVMLEPGEHDLELVYRTPYLIEGVLLSCVGAIGTLVICIVYYISKKKNS